MNIPNTFGGIIYRSNKKTLREAVVEATRKKISLQRANLQGANLQDAGLQDAYLQRANLQGANLQRANLQDANLQDAGLQRANLQRANLQGANLQDAGLQGAYLQGANLQRANLQDANLQDAGLQGANLQDAGLQDAYLQLANLQGAYLRFTCLDPDAQIPYVSNLDIQAAGFELDGDYVIGWRTEVSQVCGNTKYVPGHYKAPFFSVANTDCHPGLYVAGKKWLAYKYPNVPIVKVRFLRYHLHRAGDKWRVREFDVLG